jgi:two-component system chemotaxis sensor kinase CheA
MSVDLSQFYQVFFEESLEGLGAMEVALMELQPDDVDIETINTIFRAAHSIKGGSATFGFSSVADFTHVLETLLDEARDGKRTLTLEDIDLLLQSVDCLRAMIAALQGEQEPDTTLAHELKTQFEAILSGQQTKVTDGPGAIGQSECSDDSSAGAANQPEPDCADLEGTSDKGWLILFKPHVDILRTGNEPIRMFRELDELGDLSVYCDYSSVPSIMDLHTEECFINWRLELRGEVSEADIHEVFEWVVDECDIDVGPLNDASDLRSSEFDGALVTENKPSGHVESQDTQISPEDSDSKVISEEAASVVSVASSSPPEAGANTKKKAGANSSADTSIRVSIDKIDQLINMVGELVITQSMLGQIGQEFTAEKLSSLQEGLNQLEQNTRELQESVMQIRMLPISFSFSRFPRMVRDLSKKLGKKITLQLKGEQTELDKTVMEKIGDPLVHLVRNSLDHGIESPQERLAAGKPETGVITLNAYHQGGNVVIEIIDDGKGLDKARIMEKAIENGLIPPGDSYSDEQINDLIFHPGFSTAQVVSDVSGRGVGMDVVKRNIQELNGTIEVKSTPGSGSTFTIRLPLTLAILDGQLVRIGSQTFIFPLVSIVESLDVDISLVNMVAGGCDVFRLRDEYIPIIKLFDVFSIEAEFSEIKDALLVVVECDGEKIGIVVDELQAQQQVVIKSLEQNYRRVEGVSGATILGDGTVALILDIVGIVKLAGVRHGSANYGIPNHTDTAEQVA